MDIITALALSFFIVFFVAVAIALVATAIEFARAWKIAGDQLKAERAASKCLSHK